MPTDPLEPLNPLSRCNVVPEGYTLIVPDYPEYPDLTDEEINEINRLAGVDLTDIVWLWGYVPEEWLSAPPKPYAKPKP